MVSKAGFAEWNYATNVTDDNQKAQVSLTSGQLWGGQFVVRSVVGRTGCCQVSSLHCAYM